MCIPIVPSAAGSLPASSPSGKGVGPMRPWTLVIIGVALTAATVRAFLAPFPGIGGNPVLDLIAYHDPGLHTVIHVWYYAAPGIALLLAGSVCLSVSRVWLEPRTRRGARGKLPAWPTSATDEAPSLVIGELHHPTVPRESERPSWLVIPEKGLYTGVLVVGAVGTGKTTACMYPFAQQLLSWRADDPGRRAGVLEVKGDFCHQVRRILEDAGRADDYLQEAERVLEDSGVPVRHVAGDRAYYNLNRDEVVLPERGQFPSANHYYQTALHELGHSTGHPERMSRETLVEGIKTGFGSPDYAKEELRAEISAIMDPRELIQRPFQFTQIFWVIDQIIVKRVPKRLWFLTPPRNIPTCIYKVRCEKHELQGVGKEAQ